MIKIKVLVLVILYFMLLVVIGFVFFHYGVKTQYSENKVDGFVFRGIIKEMDSIWDSYYPWFSYCAMDTLFLVNGHVFPRESFPPAIFSDSYGVNGIDNDVVRVRKFMLDDSFNARKAKRIMFNAL